MGVFIFVLQTDVKRIVHWGRWFSAHLHRRRAGRVLRIGNEITRSQCGGFARNSHNGKAVRKG